MIRKLNDNKLNNKTDHYNHPNEKYRTEINKYAIPS